MTEDSFKARTIAIQASLLNGGPLFPLSFFDSRRYIQHNPLLEDGVGAIFAFVDALPKDRASARVCRAIEDGAYSVAHVDYRLGDWGAMVGFEIHRWEDDRIVEHWDNLQPSPTGPNRSGRTMTDGATDIRDPEQRAANKSLVERFTREVLLAGDPGALSGFFRDGALIQHNPALEDGTDSLRSALSSGRFRYDTLHKVLGEGDIVLTLCEGTSLDEAGQPAPTSFYDLYRVEAGAIAEHWDVVEVIAPRSAWRNDNGKF